MKNNLLPPPPPLSPFFTNFVGEYVRIFTKLSMEESQESEEELIRHKTPVIVVGVLLDFDDDYYYLGSKAGPNSVNQAVKIRDVSIVQIEEVVDPLTEYLEGVAIPEGSGVN